MKFYIAGPMTGKEIYNFDEFLWHEKVLKVGGFEVHNPARQELIDMFAGRVYSAEMYRKILTEDLRVIGEECDALFMLKGWMHSKGATAEHAFALALKLPIVYQEDYDKHREGFPFGNVNGAIKTLLKDQQLKQESERA